MYLCLWFLRSVTGLEKDRVEKTLGLALTSTGCVLCLFSCYDTGKRQVWLRLGCSSIFAGIFFARRLLESCSHRQAAKPPGRQPAAGPCLALLTVVHSHRSRALLLC